MFCKQDKRVQVRSVGGGSTYETVLCKYSNIVGVLRGGGGGDITNVHMLGKRDSLAYIKTASRYMWIKFTVLRCIA